LDGSEILRVEDGADVGGHVGAHVESVDVSLGVFLEMTARRDWSFSANRLTGRA